MDRLPQRRPADNLPLLAFAVVLVALVVTFGGFMFYAGAQSTLQPCLAARLDTLMARSDSIRRLSIDARTR